MTKNNKNEFEHEIISTLRKGIGLIILAILPLILFFVLPEVKPEEEPIFTWFQRSGSIMVIFAILMELVVYPVNSIMNLPRYAITINEFPEQAVELYKPYYTAMVISGYVVAILGTIIWGYGDLLVSLFLE